jgi:hypothetical protein
MSPTWRRPAAAAAVGLLALSGCTSSTWDTSQIDNTTPTTVKKYAKTTAGLTESLTDYLAKVGTDLDDWAPPKDQAKCAAQRLVRRLTVDHLLDLGYDPQKPTLALAYPADERTSVVNILAGCIDVSQGVLEMYSSYQKLPLAQSNCMSKGFARLGLDRDLIGSMVDGKEPDPFANSDHYASGLSALAIECMQEDDLLPNAPMPGLPTSSVPDTSTTTTTLPEFENDDGLEGIEPGGPLDTTTTTQPE